MNLINVLTELSAFLVVLAAFCFRLQQNNLHSETERLRRTKCSI